MKITYSGALAAVELQDPETKKLYPCKRGETIDVPEKLGRELQSLPDWKAATQTKKETNL